MSNQSSSTAWAWATRTLKPTQSRTVSRRLCRKNRFWSGENHAKKSKVREKLRGVRRSDVAIVATEAIVCVDFFATLHRGALTRLASPPSVATESFKKNMAGATSVRKHLKDDSSDLHLQNKFNKQEFFTSLVYETLPPVILSPLFAVFMEGPERAYHLVNHRLFLPVDKR